MKKTAFWLWICLLLAGMPAHAAFISVKNADAPEKFALYEVPKSAPTATFFNAKDEPVRLSDFEGKIVMVNVWAQSCRQCIVELPMLNALQESFGTTRFVVIPLSVGGETGGNIARFFIQNQWKHLAAYTDNDAAFSLAAGVTGLPTTLLFDAQGREIGRIRGIAEWHSPMIKAQIRTLIKEEKERREKEAQQSATLQQEMDAGVSATSSLSEFDVHRWFKK